MSQPADSSRFDSHQLPPNAILCPQCGSPDTAKYKWPSDAQSKIFHVNHPETRICVDCRYVWWRD